MSISKATSSSLLALPLRVFYKNAAGELYAYDFETTFKDNLAYETLALRLKLPAIVDAQRAYLTVASYLAHLHVQHYPDEAPTELVGYGYVDFVRVIEGVEPILDNEADGEDAVPPSISGEL